MTTPAANAGPDQNVTTGTLVTLDGAASTTNNGKTLTYSWSFDSVPQGSTATLSSTTSPQPTFTADRDGAYVVRLVVNDTTADSAADTVTITAATGNSAPVANAGPDQNVKTGGLVTLDGAASSDANGNALTYRWSFDSAPPGSTAALSSSNSANPSFVADIDGQYVVRLVVNDGTVDGTADTVTITASTGNSAPVANAGPDQNVIMGASVILDGRGSSDANNDPLTYTWSFASVPQGSTAALAYSTTDKPSFVADLSGIYVVSLVVNDGAANSVADTVTINVLSSNALILDGVEDRAQAGATVFPDSATAASFTVEAWIYPTAAATAVIAADDAYNLLLIQQNGGANSGIGIQFSLYTACDTVINHIEFRDVTLNKWNHVAAMYSAEEGKIWLSIQGVVSSTPTPVTVNTLCTDPTYQFTVGGFYSNSANTFTGKIDDVRVSKGARYISNMQAEPVIQADANTVTVWNFNEAQGSTAFSGSGLTNLTLQPMGNAHLGAE